MKRPGRWYGKRRSAEDTAVWWSLFLLTALAFAVTLSAQAYL
jgi:hypothetical protein